MATNDTKFVNFTFNWKVEWSEYDKINKNGFPRKYFTTSYNNVVFQWHAYFITSKADDATTIGLGIAYVDGPLETIKGVGSKIGIVKSDGSVRGIRTANSYDVIRGRGCLFDAFDDKDSATVRTKYELKEIDALVYNITLRFPMEAFTFAPTPTPKLFPHADRFQSIRNPDSSKFYDAVLISGDGVEFYCHKVIVGQTEPLDTLLSDPLAGLLEKPKSPAKGRRGKKRKAMDSEVNEGASAAATDNPSTDEKKRYKFKEMATSTLKALIEYLYTGQSTLTELTIAEIIGVADAAEQYLLKPLKELCIADLWRRVAVNPESAFEIARFADLHDDCKYLKRRAIDVIVENYQKLNVKPKLLPARFGGTRRQELKDELMDFMEQRLRPYYGPW